MALDGLMGRMADKPGIQFPDAQTVERASCWGPPGAQIYRRFTARPCRLTLADYPKPDALSEDGAET